MSGFCATTLFLLKMVFAPAVEVERVLALVNGVPVLWSDVELAKISALVPRLPGEDEAQYEGAILEALIVLELRYQDLVAAHLNERLAVDWERAWQKVVRQVGGEEKLTQRLLEAGLSRESLVRMVRRAALVEAYVAKRFLSSISVTQEDLQKAYQAMFPSGWRQGQSPPPFEQVRGQLEQLVRETKLKEAVDRWTQDLAQRGEVIRYRR